MNVDFRVEIGMGAGGPDGYPVVFRTADGEEAPGNLRLPPSQELEALASRVPDAVMASSARRRRAASDDETPVRELGTLLFDALLRGTGEGLLLSARNNAARQGGRVRMVLSIQPPELASLPWEFLYDTDEDDYLCLEVPLVRHLQVRRPLERLKITPPLRILGMVAQPHDQERLQAAVEQERLREALAPLEAEGLVELDWVAGQTWRELHDKVQYDARDGARRDTWHVLHFIGHGGYDTRNREGTLVLADEQGGSDPLGASELARLLNSHRSLRLVVLNACETGRTDGLNQFSSVAGALIRKAIPAVLAMQYEVSEPAAQECARSFYNALARRLPIDEAVTSARQSMTYARRGTLEWGTPVLYMRSLDYNGQLFDVAAIPAPVSLERRQRGATTDTDLSALYYEGVAALYTDRWDEAVDAFRTVVAQDHAYRDAQAKLAEARRGQQLAGLYAAATASMAEGRWDRAVEQLEAVTATEPDHPDAAALLERARAEKARAGLREEIEALHARGQWEAVVAAAERMRRVAPEAEPDPEVTGMVGAARAELGLAEIANRVAEVAEVAERIAERGARNAEHDDRNAEHIDRTAGPAARAGRDDRSADTGAGALTESLTAAIRAPSTVQRVAFSPDGERLAVACAERVALITDLDDRQRLTLRHGGWLAGVWDIAFAPDGSRVATASADKTARIWDARTGAELLKIPHSGAVIGVAFSPDGRRLATACRDYKARVWDARTGAKLAKAAHANWVRKVTFSPDGLRIATASTDNTARVWDSRTGAALLKLPHGDTVYDVAFSPDGRRLATVSDDTAARIWDAESGTELLHMTHSGMVHDVAFSPDGRRLATVAGLTARVWDAVTGAELLSHRHHGPGIAFGPDGTHLATTMGSLVQIWQLTEGPRP